MATLKKPTAIRLTGEGKELLENLSRQLGVTQTAVMEMAIRRMAQQEKVARVSDKEAVVA